MDQAHDNPASNQIGPGLTEADVLSAVDRSGYPLQTVVADLLRPTLGVHEEWSYIDRNTKELRSVDLHANLRLHHWNPQPRVRPQLDLLIECKKSQLPYIFFLSRNAPYFLGFPIVAGLARDKIEITTDDDPSTWMLTVTDALGLESDAFLAEPAYCHTLSRCVRKGSELELSGSDAYNSLVLPLVKALHHFKSAVQPVSNGLVL